MIQPYTIVAAPSQVIPGDILVARIERRKEIPIEWTAVLDTAYTAHDDMWEYNTPRGTLRARTGVVAFRVARKPLGTLKMGTRECVAQQAMSYDDRCWYAHEVEYTGECLNAWGAERLAQRLTLLSREPGQRWFPRSSLVQGFAICNIYVVDLGAGKGLVITEEYHGIGD